MTDRYKDYDNWAWLYNKTLGPEYALKRLPVLQRVLLPKVRPDSKLFDLCCGTGHLSRLLIQRGYKVTGLDGSESMLTFARINAPAASFLLADARTFEVSDKFDGAFCFSAALNHIETVVELREVFRRVADALEAGGLFVFDINTPDCMRTLWRGAPIVGEIKPTYAWVCATHYDGCTNSGSFTIDTYCPEARGSPTKNLGFSQRLIAKTLSHKFLMKPRLSLLQRFNRFHSGWKHTRLTYRIWGHDLSKISQALTQSGFTDVLVQTPEGASHLSRKDSALFVCVK